MLDTSICGCMHYPDYNPVLAKNKRKYEFSHRQMKMLIGKTESWSVPAGGFHPKGD